MPPTPPSQRMGELHEIELAVVFGGTKTKASGSQWTDPADGANHHDDPFAFRWDGKSTKAKSLTITLDMIRKIEEQAGGERPAIGIRFYGNEVLTQVLADWSAMKNADLSELLLAARRAAELEAELETYKAQVASLTMLQEEAQTAQAAAQEALDACRAQLEAQGRPGQQTAFGGATGGPGGGGGGAIGGGGGANAGAGSPGGGGGGGGGGRMTPEYVPMLPWTVIYEEHAPGRVYLTGEYYDRGGYRSQIIVETVVVERSLGSANRPRLIVNGVRVPHGSLYVDGHLTTRAAETQPNIEVG